MDNIVINDTLNIKDWPEKDFLLNVAIMNAVKSMGKSGPVPNVLKMNKEQYVMLTNHIDTIASYDSRDLLYRTPYNVMEVLVV